MEEKEEMKGKRVAKSVDSKDTKEKGEKTRKTASADLKEKISAKKKENAVAEKVKEKNCIRGTEAGAPGGDDRQRRICLPAQWSGHDQQCESPPHLGFRRGCAVPRLERGCIHGGADSVQQWDSGKAGCISADL